MSGNWTVPSPGGLKEGGCEDQKTHLPLVPIDSTPHFPILSTTSTPTTQNLGGIIGSQGTGGEGGGVRGLRHRVGLTLLHVIYTLLIGPQQILEKIKR